MKDKLTDTAIRKATPKVKPYKLSDGAGLHLLVMPIGSKLWRFRYYTSGKKESMLGFGAYDPGSPEHISLARARELRDEARRMRKDGKNPAQERRRMNRPPVARNSNGAVTFREAALAWHEDWGRASRDEHYVGVVKRRLERHLFGEIGDTGVSAVTGPQLLAAIKKIENAGSIDLSRRMYTTSRQIFRYSVAHGWAERDPSYDIPAALSQRPRPKHRTPLKSADLPEFFANLEKYNAYRITKLAVVFTLLTAARTGETRFAVWSEIEDLDGEAPLWRIPAERMKMTKPHLVPLAPQAVEILKEARALYPGSKTIFPSEESRSGYMSENAMLYLLHRMGFYKRATVHGFRGLFSTVLNESGLFHPDWIELALAHTEDDEVRAAYNSALWLLQRREMLAWWANYLDKARGVA
jgi:integrase